MEQPLLRPVISGVVSIIVMLFSVSVLLSILLHLTSLQESSLHMVLMPITFLSVFIGGCIAGFKSGARGWYYGALTGLGFILLTWLFSFLGFDSVLSMRTLWLYAAFLVLAMLGGMIGVNMSPKRKEY